MNDNVKTGLLVAFSILTLVNTVMIFSDDDVTYDRPERSVTATAPVTPATPTNTAMDNNAAVVPQNTGPKTAKNTILELLNKILQTQKYLHLLIQEMNL